MYTVTKNKQRMTRMVLDTTVEIAEVMLSFNGPSTPILEAKVRLRKTLPHIATKTCEDIQQWALGQLSRANATHHGTPPTMAQEPTFHQMLAISSIPDAPQARIHNNADLYTAQSTATTQTVQVVFTYA